MIWKVSELAPVIAEQSLVAIEALTVTSALQEYHWYAFESRSNAVCFENDAVSVSSTCMIPEIVGVALNSGGLLITVVEAEKCVTAVLAPRLFRSWLAVSARTTYFPAISRFGLKVPGCEVGV